MFANDVREGLSQAGQKQLPCQYFYDDIGTALFEAITVLPEYGLTRADTRLIRRLAPELTGYLQAPVAVAELGSGSGSKTRRILEWLARRAPVTYYPIDLSASALARCAQEMAAVADVHPIAESYLNGLRLAVCGRRPGQPLLVLFLGSTIGNFARTAAQDFPTEARACLMPGDALLLGADLIKPLARMLLAYDDPAGVTAAFNRNLLARINRELNGDFALRSYVLSHCSRINSPADIQQIGARARCLGSFAIKHISQRSGRRCNSASSEYNRVPRRPESPLSGNVSRYGE